MEKYERISIKNTIKNKFIISIWNGKKKQFRNENDKMLTYENVELSTSSISFLCTSAIGVAIHANSGRPLYSNCAKGINRNYN